MGVHRIEIEALGGHGCQREVKDGEQVKESCGGTGCPDCMAREFVQKLKATGDMIQKATITHHPGDGEVVDDLLTLTRKGTFNQ